jgi:hypothetical protein
MEATATFMFHGLLVISFDGGYGHVHALYESTSCHDLLWSFAMTIASFPTSSIRSIGLYLTCWTGSHEELFRPHPELMHSG